MQVQSLGRKIPRRRACNPLQYSCLENPMDREVWQVGVYWVAKSRAWLKRLSSSSSGILKTKPDHRLLLAEGQEWPGQVQPRPHGLHPLSCLNLILQVCPFPPYPAPVQKPKWQSMSPHAQVSPNSTLTDSFCPNFHIQHLPQLHLHQTDWPPPTPAEVTWNKIHQAPSSPPCTQVPLHKLSQALVSWLCSRKSQLVCCQRFLGVWPNKIWPAEKAEVAKLCASYWEANVWAESTGIFNRCCPDRVQYLPRTG